MEGQATFLHAIGSHRRNRLQVGGKMIGGWHIDVPSCVMSQQSAGGVALLLGTVPATDPITMRAAFCAPGLVAMAGRIPDAPRRDRATLTAPRHVGAASLHSRKGCP